MKKRTFTATALIMALLMIVSSAMTVGAALPQESNIHSMFTFESMSGTAVPDLKGDFGGIAIGGVEIYDDDVRGNVLKLDGARGSYVELDADILVGLDQVTIAAWYKAEGDQYAFWGRLWDIGTGTATHIFLTPSIGHEGRIRSVIRSGGSPEQQATATTLTPLGEWIHVAVTIDGDGNHSLYINGVLEAEAFTDTTPADMGPTFQNYLGNSQYDDEFFRGLIDDFVIWNTALTAAQIVEVMNTNFGAPGASAAAPPAAAVTPPADAAAPPAAAAPSPAPTTHNEGPILMIILMVVAAGCLTLVARRRASKI